MTSVVGPVPEHVDPSLVVDFDIYNPPGLAEDVHLAWFALTKGPPIVWTPRNGGHWIATRAEDIRRMQTDHVVFSYTGLTVPRSSTPSLPNEIDPPHHAPLRAVISPLFTPDTLRAAEARARELARELLDEVYPLGKCDFSRDFARHIPIAIFLMFVDLPLDDREMLLEFVEKRSRSPHAAERDAAKSHILEYIAEEVGKRRASPGNDFISRILHSQVQGRPLTDFEAQNMLATVLSGGLDTVASMMGFMMRYLALNPDQRRSLAADRSRIPAAVDELIRRHGVVNTARLVKTDTSLHGAFLKAGDQIVVPNSLVGLDPDQFDHSLEVDFDRKDSGKHAAFGNGPHRCPGANLSRLEIKLVLEEWLARIPEFEIDPDEPVVFGSGIINTVHSLPLRWSVAQPT
jgi:cytochrome P450